MSFEDIRKNSMTIAIASGISKVTPILGALRAGLIDILITGSQVASKLLGQDLQ
jgi:DNA-binding transcriptional regulator LsrR (DeoR family)